MAILRHLLGRAARHIASDPRAQEKAKTFLREEVRPRAGEAARKSREAYELLRDDWRDSAGAEAADEPAARRAGRFLGKLHNRLNQDPKD